MAGLVLVKNVISYYSLKRTRDNKKLNHLDSFNENRFQIYLKIFQKCVNWHKKTFHCFLEILMAIFLIGYNKAMIITRKVVPFFHPFLILILHQKLFSFFSSNLLESFITTFQWLEIEFYSWYSLHINIFVNGTHKHCAKVNTQFPVEYSSITKRQVSNWKNGFYAFLKNVKNTLELNQYIHYM